ASRASRTLWPAFQDGWPTAATLAILLLESPPDHPVFYSFPPRRSSDLSRSRNVDVSVGPPTYAILRWPRLTRCSTASRIPATLSVITDGTSSPSIVRSTNTMGRRSARSVARSEEHTSELQSR